MNLSADLREFIELLNSRGVDYVIVGAHSLVFYGCPRYTGDLDILVRPSSETAARIVPLLREFGFGTDDFKESDFTEPEQIIQIGRVSHRVELLTSLSGVEIDNAFQSKISTQLEGLPVFMLSKELRSKTNAQSLDRKISPTYMRFRNEIPRCARHDC